jgi:hypothetical protein
MKQSELYYLRLFVSRENDRYVDFPGPIAERRALEFECAAIRVSVRMAV